MSEKKDDIFVLNGDPVEVMVPVNRYLVDVIREDLGMMGTKRSCDQGACGSCSIIMDDATHQFMPHPRGARRWGEHRDDRRPRHPRRLASLQAAFASYGATQCAIARRG